MLQLGVMPILETSCLHMRLVDCISPWLGLDVAWYPCRGPGYMEVDIDVGSSSVAATVVGLVQGATKSLVVDMGIVLEGHSAEELPESLLGTVGSPSPCLYCLSAMKLPLRRHQSLRVNGLRV